MIKIKIYYNFLYFLVRNYFSQIFPKITLDQN